MGPEVSSIASLMGDPKRATMLVALIDGRALPAGELAFQANVAPQTASEHLAKLLEGRLLTVETQGRHRYYRLAGPEVADALEALAGLVPAPKQLVRGVLSDRNRELRFARTCYSHLAGKAAVALNDALREQGFLVEIPGKEYRLTEAGRGWLQELGLETRQRFGQKGFARACQDWTERRYHLAGGLGALLLARMFELHWLVRIHHSRAVRFTVKGQEELGRRFNLALR